MHLHNFQVSILVHNTYHHNPRHDAKNFDYPLLKEIHYYVSNDTSHDSLFVQHAFMLHWECLQMQGCFSSQHVLWNDGYLRQFKNAKAWYFVSQYPSLTTYSSLLTSYQMLWNFFATGHDKGEVDGVGMLFKRGKKGTTQIQGAKDTKCC